MDTVTVANSVYVDGQWATAHWMAEVVDEATGELVITATVAGAGAPHVAALRLDAALVRELRVLAGFGEPSTNLSANARMAEIDADRVDIWNDIAGMWREFARHDKAIHGAYSRINDYDAALRRELRRLELRLEALEVSVDPRLVADDDAIVAAEVER